MAKPAAVKQIREMALDYTTKRIRATMALLLFNVSDLLDEQYFDFEFDMPDELKNCIDFFIDTVKEMDMPMIKTPEVRQSIINQIAKRKNALISMAKCLCGYQDVLKDMADALRDKFLFEELKPMKEIPIDKPQFIKDCADFIESGEEHANSLIYMMEIMSCFPVKMARDKYSDYLNRALTEFFADYPEEFAESYVRYLLDKAEPKKSSCFGKYFDSILNDITELENYDIETLNAEKTRELHERAADIQSEAEAVLDELNVVYESLNYLLIIFTFADDLEKFIEDSFILKDIFYTTVSSLRNNEYELFKDNLDTLLDENTADFIDAADAASKKLSSALKRFEPDNADDELNLILTAAEVIDEMFFSDLGRECSPFLNMNATSAAKIEHPEKVINYFLDELNALLKEMPNRQRKNIRRKMLEFVVCPFSLDEFAKYISGAFDDAESFLEQAVILEKVGQVLEKYSYHGFDEDHVHEHPHEHGEHCGCEDH